MNVSRRIAILYAGLLVGNLAAWAILVDLSKGAPLLFTQGALAYVLGLRHGFDADHIAAIDNSTRKLINAQQKPLGAGMYFALGHSTIVTMLALALTVGAPIVMHRIPGIEHAGGLIGSAVSITFLFLIAMLNLFVLKDIYRRLRVARDHAATGNEALQAELVPRGPMTRLLGRVFQVVSRAWHMYLVGLLFGLGFDTATEVALLGMATLAALHRMPPEIILVLPLLFAAGMTLIDATDGVLMTAAYGWAMTNEVRKIHYNFVITLLSVMAALMVGTIEGLQVLGTQLHVTWGPWAALERLPFGTLGMIIALAMVAVWVTALVVRRHRGFDHRTYETVHDDPGVG